MTGKAPNDDANETGGDCNHTTSCKPFHDSVVRLLQRSLRLSTSPVSRTHFTQLQELHISNDYSQKVESPSSLLNDRFSGNRYIDWIKQTLSLQYTKEGIEATLEDRVDDLRKKIRVIGLENHMPRSKKRKESHPVAFSEKMQPRSTGSVALRQTNGQTSLTWPGETDKENRDVGPVNFQEQDSNRNDSIHVVLIGRVGSGKSSFVNSILSSIEDARKCNIQETTTVIDETQLQVLLDTLGNDQKRENMQTFWSKILVSDRDGTEFVFNFLQSPTNGKPFVHDKEELSPATHPPSVTKIAISENFKNSQLDTDDLQRNAGHHAAIRGDLKKLIWLVTTIGLPAEAKSSNKLTMLHLAAIHQHIPVVEYLCKAHPTLVPETDTIGRNACHIAAQKGNLPMVMMLVEHGADVYATAGDGSTLLHIAASHESNDMVRYLCENFFFNHLNNPNNICLKPIHFAARCSLPNVQILLNKGEVPHVQSQTGSTIIHVAALRGKLDILRFVCEHYGYVLMVTDNVGFSAAHQASRHGHLECLKYLLGVNSLLASMVNCHGWTIAHSAAREGQLEVLTHLWENYPHVATQVDADNRNVAHHAAQSGHINCLEYLFQHRIVDPWAADKEGVTVLDIAERHGREETVQWLRSSPFAAMVDMNNSHSHMALGRSRQNGET